MGLPPPPTHLTDLEFTRVFTTYVHSAALVGDRTVLDAGCGSGHGAWLYHAAGARRVVAVDLDPTGLREMARHDAAIGFAVMDVQALALRDRLFDVVACFEVIEHVPSPAALLRELRRVARPGAITLISTPNRVNRLAPGQRPWNPEHFREYDRAGLERELRASYRAVRILGTYGRPDLHERYLREWRIGIASSRARGLARRLIPHRVRRALRGALARREPSRTGVPAPDPATWPFWIGEVSDRCLNFVAVCGDEDEAVASAARTISARGA